MAFFLITSAILILVYQTKSSPTESGKSHFTADYPLMYHKLAGKVFCDQEYKFCSYRAQSKISPVSTVVTHFM